MPIPESKELWFKARLFINRALDSNRERDFPERAFWAASSLELLGKAALARVSPILIATPDESGGNLLAALGLIQPKNGTVITVQAKTIWSRCQQAFRPFNMDEATKISYVRNEYIHGAGLGLASLREDFWWPTFWSQAAILLDALDSDIPSFVGSERAVSAQAHLESHKEFIQNRAKSLLNRAQLRIQQRDTPLISVALSEELSRSNDVSPGLTYHQSTICPVCKGEARLEGEELASTEREVVEIDYFGIPEYAYVLEVYSDFFHCKHCGLTFDSAELISEAGADEKFLTDQIYASDYEEPEYGND